MAWAIPLLPKIRPPVVSGVFSCHNGEEGERLCWIKLITLPVMINMMLWE